LEPIANWTYNYRLKPVEEYPLEWAVKQGMEFVPMIHVTKVDLMDGSSCDMTVDSGPKACTVDKLVSVI